MSVPPYVSVNKLFASLDIENVKIRFIDYKVDRTVKLKRIVRKVI